MKKIDRLFHTAAGTLKEHAATLIAAPAIIREKIISRRADIDVKTLKRARAYGDAPNYDMKGKITAAGLTRAGAQAVKRRLMK